MHHLNPFTHTRITLYATTFKYQYLFVKDLVFCKSYPKISFKGFHFCDTEAISDQDICILDGNHFVVFHQRHYADSDWQILLKLVWEGQIKKAQEIQTRGDKRGYFVSVMEEISTTLPYSVKHGK